MEKKGIFLINTTNNEFNFYKELANQYFNNINIDILIDNPNEHIKITEKNNNYLINGLLLTENNYKQLKSILEKYEYIILYNTNFTWLFLNNFNEENKYFKDILKNKKIIVFDRQFNLPNNYHKIPFYNIANKILNTSYYSYFNQLLTIGSRHLNKKIEHVYDLYTYKKIDYHKNNMKPEEIHNIKQIISNIKDKDYKTIFGTTGTLNNLELFYHIYSNIKDKNKKSKYLLIVFDIDDLLLSYIKILFQKKIIILPLKSENYYLLSLVFKELINIFFDFSPLITDEKYQQLSFLYNIPHFTLPTYNAYFYRLNNINDMNELSKFRTNVFDYNSNLYAYINSNLKHNSYFNVLTPDNIELNVFDKINFTSYYTLYKNKTEIINNIIKYINEMPNKLPSEKKLLKYNITINNNDIQKNIDIKSMIISNKLGFINPLTNKIF